MSNSEAYGGQAPPEYTRRARLRSERGRGRGKRILLGVLFGLFVLLVVGLIAGIARANAFSNATSGKPLWASELRQRAGQGDRFNLLVMGYGGAGHEGELLTDSLLLYSVSLSGGPSVQISIPRDLWVEYPARSGRYRKVNSVFSTAMAANGNNRGAAARELERTLSAALGIPVQGWMSVDFAGFRHLVDALGGVDVTVQRSFTARYPRNDDPRVDYRWTNIRFRKGRQTMDGTRAMQYARARYASPPVEASDFARAARQQRLVSAIKAKLLSPAGVLRSFTVMGAVQGDIRTDVSAGDLARIFRRGADQQHSIVLSTENVLALGWSNDGQSILTPRNNDWGVVRRFVRQQMQPTTAVRR